MTAMSTMSAMSAISVLALLGSYLLGSVSFAVLVSRALRLADPRTYGSGNPGATNVLRSGNRAAALLTLVGDAAKGALAVWIGSCSWAGGGSDVDWLPIACGAAAFAGHVFPVFLKFKGGKAVASFIGAFLYLTPVALVAVLVVFVVTVWRTRFISLGSILAAGTFPLAVWIIVHPAWPVFLVSVLAAALIIWRHEANIGRLRAGTESIFSLRRSRG